MASLSEELAKLANPTPLFHDPEDEIDDATDARVVGKSVFHGHDGDDDTDSLQSSRLRRQSAIIFEDTDSKYAGKKVSRKTLKKIAAEESSDDEIDPSAVEAFEKMMVDKSDDDDDDDDEDDSEDDNELQSFKAEFGTSVDSKKEQKFSFEDDGNYSKYADDVDEDDVDDDDDSDSDDDDDDDDDDEQEDGSKKVKDIEDDGIESFSKSSLTEEVQKGKAAKSQLALWDNLLEERIKIQKVASIINQLPQPDSWASFVEQGGDSYMEAVTERRKCILVPQGRLIFNRFETSTAQGVLKQLLDELLRVQTLLLLRNQETKHVVDGSDPKANKGSIPDSEDEEITSESETESKPEQKKPVKSTTNERQYLKRKFKMADYPDFLSKRHKIFAEYRNETIHKWNDKTRLASGKIKGKSFSALEQTALKQIEQIMRDKNRLIRRTQLNRSGHRVFGVPETVKEENQRHREEDEEPSSEAVPKDEYDDEVFDDSDFYHQLLRELIERKTSEINDPIAISRQWLEIQKLRTKVKRKKVDTRASKGRKIRYDVHSKLMNFMAPMDNSPWSDESRNDLFKSLFGKKFRPSQAEQNAPDER